VIIKTYEIYISFFYEDLFQVMQKKCVIDYIYLDLPYMPYIGQQRYYCYIQANSQFFDE
jgi:hypothetical protein